MKTIIITLLLLLSSFAVFGQRNIRYDHSYCWKTVYVRAFSYIDSSHDIKWQYADTIMQVAERITKKYKGKNGYYGKAMDFPEFLDLDYYYLHNKRIYPINIIKRPDFMDTYTGVIPNFDINKK